MPDYVKQPRVRLAEVREYCSSKDMQYFSFYLGKAKMLMFRDEDAATSGKEVARWNLYVEEAVPFEKSATAAKPATFSKPAERGPRGSSQEARARESLRDRGFDPQGGIVE